MNHIHLWRGRRKYVTTFIGLSISAGLGIALAQWQSLPDGHGGVHGKGGSIQVVGVAFQENGSPTLDTFGPSTSGSLRIRVANTNAYPVTLTSVAPDPGAGIVSDTDPTCKATPGTDFTVGGMGTPVQFGSAGNGINDVQTISLPMSTTASWPECLADQPFTLAVTLKGNPAS